MGPQLQPRTLAMDEGARLRPLPKTVRSVAIELHENVAPIEHWQRDRFRLGTLNLTS
jgi:hypothetical protein